MLIGAVEAGGTKFVLAVARPAAQPLERVVIATGTPAQTFRAMRDWFEAAANRHGPIGAFGIGSFGPIGFASAQTD